MRLPDGARLQGTYGRWRGAEYELGSEHADGTVVLKHQGENAPAGFEKVSELLDFGTQTLKWWGAQAGLSLIDRFVYGAIPFGELTEVREEVAPFALPEAPRQG